MEREPRPFSAVSRRGAILPEQMRSVALKVCIVGLILHVHGSSVSSSREENSRKSSNTAKDRLENLILSFSSVLSLEKDRPLYNDITENLTPILGDYLSLNPTCHELVGLVHASILGVFKLQNGAIKDSLASGSSQEVRRFTISQYAHWSMDVLKVILSHMKDSACSTTELWSGHYDGRTALMISSELRLLNVAELLIENGALSVIHENRYEDTVCDIVFTLLPAIKNDDTEMASLLLEHVKGLKSSPSLSELTCRVLKSMCSNSGRDYTFSLFQVAYLHCVLLSSCEVFEYLSTAVDPQCVVLPVDSEVVKLVLSHTEPVCPGVQCTSQSNQFSYDKRGWSWVPALVRRSGWAVYSDFAVGRCGCDLPTLQLEHLTEAGFKYFQDLHIPFVLGGGMKEWKAWDLWRKRDLGSTWPELDLLLGSIPYAEVFGETSGYATVSETLVYMDSYSQQEALRFLAHESTEDWHIFQLPFYVFDGSVLEENFSSLYTLPTFFSNWSDSAVPQFILGPAGSGAPFHFHCPAINALVYGRKKWFLYPPGKGVYSKQHPLRWYSSQYYQLTVSHSSQQPVECVQQSGQLIYVPSGWSHATVNLDEAIGLAVEFEHSHC